MTDTKLFKSAYIKAGFTLARLASELGLSEQTLSYKMNNLREFKSSEIIALKKILNLSSEERDAIFFKDDVDK